MPVLITVMMATKKYEKSEAPNMQIAGKRIAFGRLFHALTHENV